jgi:hypothetical protein
MKTVLVFIRMTLVLWLKVVMVIEVETEDLLKKEEIIVVPSSMCPNTPLCMVL